MYCYNIVYSRTYLRRSYAAVVFQEALKLVIHHLEKVVVLATLSQLQSNAEFLQLAADIWRSYPSWYTNTAIAAVSAVVITSAQRFMQHNLCPNNHDVTCMFLVPGYTGCSYRSLHYIIIIIIIIIIPERARDSLHARARPTNYLNFLLL